MDRGAWRATVHGVTKSQTWLSDSVQFSSVQSLSHVQLFATPWTVACQASLSITNSWSFLKLMSIESVMPSNYLILCRPLLLLPSSFPASGSFQMSQHSKSGGQKYWSFSFNISSSNEHPGLISFRMDWLDLLAVQGTLKSLLQHYSSKESILWCSALFIVQLSHPYMTTGKMIALTFIGLATKQQQKSLLGYMPIQYVGTLNKRLIQHQACQDLNCLRKGK